MEFHPQCPYEAAVGEDFHFIGCGGLCHSPALCTTRQHWLHIGVEDYLFFLQQYWSVDEDTATSSRWNLKNMKMDRKPTTNTVVTHHRTSFDTCPPREQELLGKGLGYNWHLIDKATNNQELQRSIVDGLSVETGVRHSEWVKVIVTFWSVIIWKRLPFVGVLVVFPFHASVCVYSDIFQCNTFNSTKLNGKQQFLSLFKFYVGYTV